MLGDVLAEYEKGNNRAIGLYFPEYQLVAQSCVLRRSMKLSTIFCKNHLSAADWHSMPPSHPPGMGPLLLFRLAHPKALVVSGVDLLEPS